MVSFPVFPLANGQVTGMPHGYKLDAESNIHKENGYTFKGSNNGMFNIFFYSFLMGSTLNGKNLLLWEQILSFNSRPLFGSISVHRV